MRNRLLALAGVLVLPAVFGKFFARPLMAQVRAALVLNVDDPGRIPYQSAIFTIKAACAPDFCTFDFPMVPSGHRLVIQHVSASIAANANAVPAFVRLGSTAPTTTPSYFYATVQGAFGAVNTIQFDQPVLVYIDAGQVPNLFIQPLNGVLSVNPSQPEIAVLFGYMLDCNAGPCAAIAH